MAGIRVDPPPITVRVVDENGLPTRELKDYLYRLWARTSDPSGNVLDDASNQAKQAGDQAQTSIQLVGNAAQQIQQLALLQQQTSAALATLTDTTNSHISESEAHNSNGAIVGFNDIAQTNKVGLVLKAVSVTLPGGTSASSGGSVGAAPAAYTQSHIQSIVALLNDQSSSLSQLISDYNQLTTQLAAFKQALVDAGIM